HGMNYLGLPYSGKYTFVKTEMTWPINHMVAPKEKSVQCTECHTRENSRISNLKDFYMPARDYNATVETLGVSVILLSLIGVIVHAGMRIFSAKRNGKEH
ncbi:MAG: cytochrome C, partial [Bacteroidota bacterium]